MKVTNSLVHYEPRVLPMILFDELNLRLKS